MLFHLGALWRLNEIGYLPNLARISSVSGGSITAWVLGLKWSRLAFDAQGVSGVFDAEVVQLIRALASKNQRHHRQPSEEPAGASGYRCI